jgi:phage repressor protein C with HTH and peptisase S24 domain
VSAKNTHCGIVEIMKTLSSRIAHYRALAGMSQGQLATACGWASQSRIGNYETGTREPKIDDINKIAKALSIKPEQLLLSYSAITSGETRTPNSDDYALIRQYSATGECGGGFLNDHVELSDGLAFKRDWLARIGAKAENLAVIYASGDSMEPYIFDGDVVLFDISDIEPRHGQVYIVRRPDESVSIKRLVQQLTGDWIIKSDNPDRADEKISADTIHEIPFIGRVIWRGGNIS